MTALPLIAATLALAAAAAMAPARADTLWVEAAGQFAADAPLTPFSAPGASWSLWIALERQPALLDDPGFLRLDAYFAPQILDSEYRLDGALLPDPTHVVFYSAAFDGGIEAIFGGIPVGTPWGYNALQTYGAPYYSGSEQSPTIEAGVYPTFVEGRSPGIKIAFEGRVYDQLDTVVTISAVPLPPSAAMMLAGLAGLAAPGLWRQGRSRTLAAAQRP